MGEVHFYDGRFVRGDEPVVRLDDRGYLFGDGVYDAWMAYGGRHFLRDEHLDRLERSCAALGIEPSLPRAEVEAVTDELLRRSGARRGLVYLQWTRGCQSPRAHAPAEGLRAVLSGFCREASAYPDSFYEEGVGTIFYPDRRHLLCDVKTLNLLGSVMASGAARAAGCHEAILVREEGGRRFVTESSRSNCYAVVRGAIHTAPRGPYILPGVTRELALGLARGLGIEAVEEFLTPQEFAAADEVFISAASGILPVRAIDGRRVGTGERPICAALMKAYDALIASA